MALKEWFKSNKFDLRGSIGFGDSHHDLSFMRMVDVPVALNPTPELFKIAKKAGWIVHKPEDDTEKLLVQIRRLLLQPLKAAKLPASGR